MKRMLLALGAISTVVVAGCASTKITKAVQVGSEEICIVDNANDRQAFRDAYERTILAKGYKPRVVNDAKACQVITTYSSKLGYDGWGAYLADADLKVFSGDKLLGQAKYHAPPGLGSHGNVEAKIAALVDQMLPPSVAVNQ